MDQTSRAILKIYDVIAFHPKKRYAIGIIDGVMILWMMISLYPNEQHYPKELLDLMISLICYMLTAWLVMDMHHPIELHLIGEITYSKLMRLKIINILIHIVLFAAHVMCIEIVITMFYGYPIPFDTIINRYTHILLDMTLLSSGVLLISRYKHPTLSLIVPLWMILWRMITFDEGSLLLYKIFPVYQASMHTFSLVFYYKLCYISMVWLITTYILKKVAKISSFS